MSKVVKLGAELKALKDRKKELAEKMSNVEKEFIILEKNLNDFIINNKEELWGSIKNTFYLSPYKNLIYVTDILYCKYGGELEVLTVDIDKGKETLGMYVSIRKLACFINDPQYSQVERKIDPRLLEIMDSMLKVYRELYTEGGSDK